MGHAGRKASDGAGSTGHTGGFGRKPGADRSIGARLTALAIVAAAALLVVAVQAAAQALVVLALLISS